MRITSLNQLDRNGYYTYQDYMSWEFPERVELFRGKLFELSPAPNRRHQTISTKLQGQLYQFFEQQVCELFSAPFDVRLPGSSTNGRIDTVVQPDLCVVCDKKKLDKQGCIGAPDLVIEIVSPGNSRKELREKFSLYESSGVKEYWLVQPLFDSVIPYFLNEQGRFIGGPPSAVDGFIHSFLFPELMIDLAKVFVFEGEG